MHCLFVEETQLSEKCLSGIKIEQMLIQSDPVEGLVSEKSVTVHKNVTKINTKANRGEFITTPCAVNNKERYAAVNRKVNLLSASV